jgi:hypothetical protein
MQYFANLAKMTGKDRKMDNLNVQHVMKLISLKIFQERNKI